MHTFSLTPQQRVLLDEHITFRKFLSWQKQAQAIGGGESRILRAMILEAVLFERGAEQEPQRLTPEQYERLPVVFAQRLNAWLAETLLLSALPVSEETTEQEETTDEQDADTWQLPSGQRVRFRIALTADQLYAEKWAAKQGAHLQTAYLLERVFTFHNKATGEYEPRTVEDILEMSVQDGFAMTELLTSEETNADFFEDFWGSLSGNSPSDSSITVSRTRKSKK